MDISHGTESIADIVLIALFLLAGLIQMGYYLIYFRRIAFFLPSPRHPHENPVSVVICARNEYHNLVKNLPLVLEQEYAEFEVVVVDDGSDDETEQYLRQLKPRYPHLKVIHLRDSVNFFKGKKLPLSVGIKSASYNNLLLTDADCRPRSAHWITRMADNLTDNREIVLGYGAYEKRPGFLNKLIRLDTLTAAMQYFGMALAGKPYMGVGRNLAYKRELFYRAKGFTRHYKVISGDDDLFINQMADAGNVAVEISPQSHTLSVPKTTFRSWFVQKRRHLSAAPYYKKRDKRILGLFNLSQLLFFPLFVVSLISAGISLAGFIVAIVYLSRLLIKSVIVYRLSRKLEERDLFLCSLLCEFVLVFITFIIVLTSFFYKKNNWK